MSVPKAPNIYNKLNKFLKVYLSTIMKLQKSSAVSKCFLNINEASKTFKKISQLLKTKTLSDESLIKLP